MTSNQVTGNGSTDGIVSEDEFPDIDDELIFDEPSLKDIETYYGDYELSITVDKSLTFMDAKSYKLVGY